MTEKDQPDQPDEATPEGVEEPEPEPRRGKIRFQDPETSEPRAPTIGEQRARRKALEREAEEETALVEAERKSKTRRRILIGSGVTVGVVALVSVWYSAARPSEVTANCVAGNDVLASDENVCDETYVRSHGGYVSNGIFFLPLVGGGGYSQYHYNYGGVVGPGGRVSGGSIAAPSAKVTVRTPSGKTVQRGGFGVSGGSKSGGS